jgi:hypothetical protein
LFLSVFECFIVFSVLQHASECFNMVQNASACFRVFQSCLKMTLYYLRMDKSCWWVMKKLLLVSKSFRRLWKSYASWSKSCLWESESYLKALRSCLKIISILSRKCLWFFSKVSMTCWKKCRSCVKVPIWWRECL